MDGTPLDTCQPIEPDDDVRCFDGCGQVATFARPAGHNTDHLVCDEHARSPQPE